MANRLGTWLSCLAASSASPMQMRLLLMLLLVCMHQLQATEGAACPARAVYVPEQTTGLKSDGTNNGLFDDFQSECCASGRTLNWTIATTNLTKYTNPIRGAIAVIAAECSSGERISTPLYGYNGTQPCQNNDTEPSQTLSQPQADGAFFYITYDAFQVTSFMGVGAERSYQRGTISCPGGTYPIGVGARSSCYSIVGLQVICAKTNETQDNLAALEADGQCSASTSLANNVSLVDPRPWSYSGSSAYEPAFSFGSSETLTDCCPPGEAILNWTIALATTTLGNNTGLIQGQCTDGTFLAPLMYGFNGTGREVCNQQRLGTVYHYFTPKSQQLYYSAEVFQANTTASSTDDTPSSHVLGSFMAPTAGNVFYSRTRNSLACPPGQGAVGYAGASSCYSLSNVSILCGNLSDSAKTALELYGSTEANPPTDAEAGVCPGGLSIVGMSEEKDYYNDASGTMRVSSSLKSICCPSGKIITAFIVWPSVTSPPLVGMIASVCSDVDGSNPVNNTATITYGFNGTFLNGTASYCPNRIGKMKIGDLENESWTYRIMSDFERLMEWPDTYTNSTTAVSTARCPSGQNPLGFQARSSCQSLTDFSVVCGNARFVSSSPATPAASAEPAAQAGESAGKIAGIIVGVTAAAVLTALVSALLLYRRYRDHKRRTCIDSRRLFNLNGPAGFAAGVTTAGMDSMQSSTDSSGSSRLLANGLLTIEDIGCTNDDTPVCFEGIPPEWEIKPNQLKLHSVDGKPIELGRGGFGVVLYGTVHKEDAAIKMMKGRSQEAELLKEIAILERAKTKYVVRFLGYSVCPDGLFLAMEYMQGGNLWQALRKSEVFQWYNSGEQAFKDICKGMYMLHSNRIAHLDMKTPNILIADDCTCKISDLGLGRLLKPDAHDTTAEGMGSFAWMAPEQMLGRCGFSSDIWALSTIIWEICTLQHPTREASPADIEVPGQAPQAVVDLMIACRNEDPKQRPLIGEICDLLEDWDGRRTHAWSRRRSSRKVQFKPISNISAKS